MANNDSKNVSVGKPMADGAVFVAPVGTTLPTDASTALPADFENVGYISEDGITNTIETDSEDIKAWGGDVVLTPQTSYKETFTYTMIEINATALKHAYGSANVTIADSGAISVKHNGTEKDEAIVVIEKLLSNNRVSRTVIPRGKVAEVGDVEYKDDTAIGRELTLNALVDTDGNSSFEYIAEVSE